MSNSTNLEFKKLLLNFSLFLSFSLSGWSNKSISNASNEPVSRCSDGDFLQAAVYSSTEVHTHTHTVAYSTHTVTPPCHVLYTPGLICVCVSQSAGVNGSDTVNYRDFSSETDGPLWLDLNQSPLTPAFPITPPTPYGKS